MRLFIKRMALLLLLSLIGAATYAQTTSDPPDGDTRSDKLYVYRYNTMGLSANLEHFTISWPNVHVGTLMNYINNTPQSATSDGLYISPYWASNVGSGIFGLRFTYLLHPLSKTLTYYPLVQIGQESTDLLKTGELRLGAGAQYKLNRKFSVFAELGTSKTPLFAGIVWYGLKN